MYLGEAFRRIAVIDSTATLNNDVIKNIERMIKAEKQMMTFRRLRRLV